MTGERKCDYGESCVVYGLVADMNSVRALLDTRRSELLKSGSPTESQALAAKVAALESQVDGLNGKITSKACSRCPYK